MKIHIIGCSGSGKTYLANALSKKYNISHFDLDDIQWDNNAKEYGKKRTLDERKALLQEILYNNDEWIIEGVYYAWVQQSFDEADKIYVLDMMERQSITEELKARDQMAWVRAVNGIRNMAEEIVLNELIYR